MVARKEGCAWGIPTSPQELSFGWVNQFQAHENVAAAGV